MTDKLQKLNDLVKLLQNDTLTPKQVEQFLGLMIKAIKQANDNFKNLSAEQLQEIRNALAYIETNRQSILKAAQETGSRIQQANQLLEQVRQIKAAPGKDGKDGYTPVKGVDYFDGAPGKDGSSDTAEQLLEKLHDLPDSDNYKIDASRIKNLPKTSLFHMGGAGRMKVYTHDLSSQCDGNTKTFTIANNNFGILGLFSTQAPIIYRPIIDYIVSNITLTLTSQVDAPQAGQTLIIQYIR